MKKMQFHRQQQQQQYVLRAHVLPISHYRKLKAKRFLH